MDSMRDPHIYCNQHSDQNMACVINMVGCHGQQQLKIMRDSDLFPLFGRRHTTYLVCPLIAEGYTRLHKQSQIINLTSLVACGGSLGCTLDAPPHIYQSPSGASALMARCIAKGQP